MNFKILAAIGFVATSFWLAFLASVNASNFYYNTYLFPDPSAAEADVVLLWMQVPLALASLVIGAMIARSGYRALHD